MSELGKLFFDPNGPFGWRSDFLWTAASAIVIPILATIVIGWWNSRKFVPIRRASARDFRDGYLRLVAKISALGAQQRSHGDVRNAYAAFDEMCQHISKSPAYYGYAFDGTVSKRWGEYYDQVSEIWFWMGALYNADDVGNRETREEIISKPETFVTKKIGADHFRNLSRTFQRFCQVLGDREMRQTPEYLPEELQAIFIQATREMATTGPSP